jgi:1,4-dihydroxy-2-naphthoate octaprenyltransferase
MTSSVSQTVSPRQAWLLASRPRTLPAAVAPVFVGSALAVQADLFHWPSALAALITAVALQVAANFANDLGDFKRGADITGRVGPTRATTAGLISPGAMSLGMWLAFSAAALAGLYLVWRGGWPALIVGLASILAGLAYTLGPFPLGYYGLGDLAVFIFFGLVGVVGTYYVQAMEVTALSVVASIPVGALVTAILVVNNIRDADTDRQAGKRTLAVLLGRRGARIEFLVLIGVAYLIPVVLLPWFDQVGWILLPWLTLPIAVGLIRIVLAVLGPALNKALAGTARLAALFSALFALGLILG